MTHFRAYHDNILVQLEPRETTALPGGVIVHPGFAYRDDGTGRNDAVIEQDPRKRPTAVRWGRVLAVGPGHVPGCRKCGGERKGSFVPTTIKVGERVVIGEQSGYDYTFDVRGARQRDKTESFEAVGELTGEFRVVREDECLAVDDGAGVNQ